MKWLVVVNGRAYSWKGLSHSCSHVLLGQMKRDENDFVALGHHREGHISGPVDFTVQGACSDRLNVVVVTIFVF